MKKFMTSQIYMKVESIMKMKAIYSAMLMVAVVTLLVTVIPLKPVYAADMDDRIESSAKQSYVFKTYLKDDDITIKSNDGIVSLTGIVANEYHKSLAQETLANLPGVKSVDNKLELKGAPPAKSSDSWIMTKVKATLLFHRSVSAGTEVNVKDGIVTLQGNATSEAQKELTTEYAKDVDGVKEVKNNMTISDASGKTPQTTGEKIDDASITAQAKMALLLHRSTSALYTTVETTRGEVTVSGKATNTAEKNLVSKLINDVPGVNSINNKMTIE